MHDRRATRANCRADGRIRTEPSPPWQGGAAPSGFVRRVSRVAFQPRTEPASHRSIGDRAIIGGASRAPVLLVEVTRFELAIPCAQGRCSTRLSHTSLVEERPLLRVPFRGSLRRTCGLVSSGWAARESNPDHLIKSQVHHRNACDPITVPPPGIEPGPLGLQPSAQTNYARVASSRERRSSSCGSSRFIVVVQLFNFHRPVFTAPALVELVDSRVKQSAFRSRPRSRTLIDGFRNRCPTDWTSLDRDQRSVVGLEGFEPPPHRVKAEHAATTPQTQDGSCGRAFELLRHHFLSWVPLESNQDGAEARLGYSQARSHAGLRTRKRKEPPLRAAPDRFGLSAWVTRLEPSLRTSWAAARA